MVVGIDYFQGYTEYELPLAEAYVQNIPNTVVETMTDYAIKMCYEDL